MELFQDHSKYPARYVIDTSVIIALWNQFCRPDTTPSYWDAWAKTKSRLIIVPQVLKELEKGSERDYYFGKMSISTSVKDHLSIDSGVNDETLKKVIQHGENCFKNDKNKGGNKKLDQFLINADPYVIACAQECAATVVTNERTTGGALKIPNLCQSLSISCIDIPVFHKAIFHIEVSVITE